MHRVAKPKQLCLFVLNVLPAEISFFTLNLFYFSERRLMFRLFEIKLGVLIIAALCVNKLQEELRTHLLSTLYF